MILSPITFPGLGISVDPPRIAFYLGQKPIYWYGIIIAIGVGLILIGGIRRIGKVTETLVPFMALLYLILGLGVVLLNIQHALWKDCGY